VSRGRLIGAVLVALGCAALCAGAASAAGTGAAEEPVEPPGFELQGTHGYEISVSFYSDPETGRESIAVTAVRGKESVGYLAPAKLTAESVHADLGRLGRVDLVLHKSGEEKTVRSRCFHEKESYEPGTYEGIFEFDGEGGFTRARATQVAGVPTLALLARSRYCSDNESYGESIGASQPGARLRGISFSGGRSLKFQFNKNRANGKTLFSASLNERRDGIRIYRQAGGTVAASAFRYDPKLRSATLAPPAPFSGSARISRDPNSVSPLVSGDLQLAFPGHTVKLTGPAVHVSLAHARRTTGNGNSASISFGSN
jgi:hypothetical protein